MVIVMSGITEQKKGKTSVSFGGSMRSRRRNKMIADVSAFTIVLVLASFVLLPIWWVFRSSLIGSLDIFLWPPKFFPQGTINPAKWLWSNYIIKPTTFNFFRYLANSLTIVIPCVVFGTTTAISCAYAFARLRFKGKKFLFSLCVGSMLLPTTVTLIPLYIVWSNIGLADTYYPLVLPFLCGGGAFNIFLLRQFIMSIPRELDEAAKIDGAGYFRTLVSIIVPAIKPAIIVIGLLIFIATWNDLLQHMIYIHTKEKFTLVLGLTVFMGSFKADFAGMFAATVLTLIPGIIVFLIGQRYFIEGIVMTGMKN